MKKYFSSLVLISIFAMLLMSMNSKTAKDNLLSQADLMTNSLISKDFKVFLKYNSPVIIELMGGEEAAVDMLSKQMAQINILSIDLSDPSEIINFNEELQATMTQDVVVEMPQGKIKNRSTLIGISSDNGENWIFIDAQGQPLEQLKTYFPNLSPDLELLPRSQPEIIYDEPAEKIDE